MSKTVAITGTSRGIGRAIAKLFLKNGFRVWGWDKDSSPFPQNSNYRHIQTDVCDLDYDHLDVPVFDIVINNVGQQTPVKCGSSDIRVNLESVISFTEHFLVDKPQAILFIGSSSAHTGHEFPEYVASKAGLVGYMKNVATRCAKWGCVCNSLDPGGVITELNKPVLEDPGLWSKIMDVTPLKRWATPEEIATWAYFLTVQQSFCTGQSILVDGGERDCLSTFVWPD